MQTMKKNCRSFTRITDRTESVTPYLLDRKRAAAMLSISVRRIDYLLSEGRIKACRIGGRVLIATEELRRFAETDSSEPMVPVTTTKVVEMTKASFQSWPLLYAAQECEREWCK